MGCIWPQPETRHEEPAPAQAAVGPDRPRHGLRRRGRDLRCSAVGEGSSREAQRQYREGSAPTNIIYRSIKPTDESQASGGRPARILNYGLKYEDYDRILATVPTIKKALPIREIRKQIRHLNKALHRRPGRRHDRRITPSSTTWRSSTRPLPHAVRQRAATRTTPCSPTTRPGNSSRIDRPGRPVVSSSGPDYYTIVGVTKQRTRSPPASAAASRRRTSTRTSTSRSTPAASGSASGSSTAARARCRSRRPITLADHPASRARHRAQVRPTAPLHRGGRQAEARPRKTWT